MNAETPHRAWSLAAAAISCLFLVAACGEAPAPTTTTTTVAPTTTTTTIPTVEDVLAEIGDNMAALSSARFRMVDEAETGAPFFGTEFKSMEAVVRTPNDFRMLVNVVAPAFGFVEVEIVKVGDEAFIKLSKDAPWAPLPPDQVPFDFSGLAVVFADLPATLQDPVLAGQETLEGVETLRVEGSVGSGVLAPLITSADAGHEVSLVLWVEEGDYALRQIRIAGQIYDADGPETVRLLNLDDVNIPVEIELPDVNSGG